MDNEDFHTLRLMGEIERAGSSTQRELSRRLDLSLGLVNTFIKRLVNKGYFKVKTMPRNRVKYFLTPKGLARKSRLTVEYLRYSVNFYKEIKSLLLRKFAEMEQSDVRNVLFLGAGEVAELAYLYVQPTRIELLGVIDAEKKGADFFDFGVEDYSRLDENDWDSVLITCLEDTEGHAKALVDRGIEPGRIAFL